MASMPSNLLVFSTARKKLSTLIRRHVQICSMQLLFVQYRWSMTVVCCFWPRATKNWKEVQKLEARINSLKVLALTLLREVESLEEQGANSAPGPLNLQTEVHRFEAEMIRSALIRTGGRQRRAARLLGMKTTTLNSKIRRYQIEIKEM
jgi:DNA-binding NtrC family response regulator